MPYIRYTVEELRLLKDSPLIRKPESLVSLDQWMENIAAEQNNQRRKQQNTRGEEAKENEADSMARPLFSTTRHASGRNNSEDFILGPPKTNFVSSGRNQNRNSNEHEKGPDRYNATTFGDDERPSNGRTRGGLREQDGEKRERGNILGRRVENRDNDAEGWSTVDRRRKSQNEEGAERWRPGDRARKEVEPVEEQPRRNAPGRGGGRMGAWRDEQADAADSTRLGGRWRERERERDDREHQREPVRDRNRDRDWTRGHKVQDRVDEEPEWMNEPVTKPEVKEEKTQADFEKWKAEQRAKSGQPDREELVAVKDVKPAEPTKPMLDYTGFSFGFAKKEPDAKKPESATAEKLPQLKGLGKASKFGAFFQKEETPPAEPEPQPEPQRAPPPQQYMPQQPPPQAISPLNVAPSSREDTEGFARILQMLGNTKLQSPQPQQTVDPVQHTRLPMFPTGMPMEAEQRQNNSSRADSASLVNELLARHTANRSRGPPTAPLESSEASQYFPGAGGDYPRMNGREEHVAQRGPPMFSPPLATNGSRGRPQTPTDQQRDFLLKLIQADREGKSKPVPEMFQHGFPQNGQRNTPSAPPGLHEQMYNRQQVEHDMGLRKTQSRPQGGGQGLPMQFFDEQHDPAIMGGMPGLMRRNTAEQQAQQQQLRQQPTASNMGIPSQHASADPYRMNMPPQQQQQGDRMAPPPGFGGLPRPPPGFQPPLPQQGGQQHVASPGGQGQGQGQMGMRGMPPAGMFGPMGGPPPPPGYFPQGGMGGAGGMGGGPPPPGFMPGEFFARQQLQQGQNGGGRFLPEDMVRGMQGRPGGPPGFM